MRRAALLAAVALATCVPSAAAHGGGGSRYRSAVTQISPATAGLTAKVVQGDDQLQITNASGKTVVVLGYENEPYLRFRPDGRVDVNVLSPANSLNLTRYGNVTVSPNADPKASPKWRTLRTKSTFTWHDHRIHWMSTIDPPVVRSARGSRHHIFDWNVALRVDGRVTAVRGTLDYVPPVSTSPLWLIAPVAAVLAAGALFTFTSPRFKARGKRQPGKRAQGRR